MSGGTTYTTTQLVQLGKAESVRVFDDESVGVWNVQTGFNDGGTHEHLNVTVCHGLHHIAQRIFTHLAVGNRHG
jgi:hypothetical protein